MRSTRVAVALSIVAHGWLFYGFLAREALAIAGDAQPPASGAARLGPAIVARSARGAKALRVPALRRALVAKARADLAQHRLALGPFLIDASAIDAEEEGREIDVARARTEFAARVASLAAAEDRDGLRAAVPRVFGDVRYFGVLGGSFVDALLARGGACEAVSQIVVAAAYDAGRGADVALRFYGGGDPQHLAPIALGRGGDLDLATGKPAVKGGVTLRPEELVEVYARSHGLAEPLAIPRTGPGEDAGGAGASRPDGAKIEGYPPNDDAFPGGVPLYAARALAPPATDKGGGLAGALVLGDEDVDHAVQRCAAAIGLDAVDPGITRLGATDVEVRRVPTPGLIERRAARLRRVEELAAHGALDAADALVRDACVAALGDQLAIDLALIDEPVLAQIAQTKAHQARVDGEAGLARLRASPQATSVRKDIAQRYRGDAWILLLLRGGDQVVLDLVRESKPEDWGALKWLAALFVSPRTRSAVAGLVSKLDAYEQVALMHDIDFARVVGDEEWPSTVGLDDELLASDDERVRDFAHVYRVFQSTTSPWSPALTRTPGVDPPKAQEVVDAIEAAADREHVPPAFRAALLEYFARMVLMGHVDREDGLEAAGNLVAALDSTKEPALALFSRRIRDVLAKGRLDADTLSDAWRIR